MQLRNILIYFLIFCFNSIHLVSSPDPNGNDSNNSTVEHESRKDSSSTKRFSIFSGSTGKTALGSSNSGSISSVASSSSSSSSRSGSGFGFNISSALTNSIVLDFNASEISNDFEIHQNIPGILKYCAKSSASGTFNKIKGNGKELNFTKKIDYVLCNSPFDNNITVVFEDETSEEYYLNDDGFGTPKEDVRDEQEEPQQLSQRISVSGIELNLLNPSDDFICEEVGGIKCYKPKKLENIISKIKIENSLRILESDILENFVCILPESSSYSIMVVYRGIENKWLKYTLSRSSSSPILMDVTLIRKFETVDPETMFVDKSTPEDNSEFTYNNLVVNGTDKGIMKSKTKGNKVFLLEITNTSDNTTSKYTVEFDKHFHVLEGFMFYAIRCKQDLSEMIFSYTNENVLFHEKYVKIEDKYHRDLKTVYKHDINRTKKYLDINVRDERVIFMKTLVPDCIEQGLKLSHYGKFKVVDFEKASIPTFLIFPNLEFFLNGNIEHRLILCENGRNVSFVMDTEINNQRVKYVVGTDTSKGNPFSIMATFDPLKDG